MAIRNILNEKEDVLKKISRPVDKFDSRLAMLLDDMIETMRSADGVGLAAVQVGVLRRVVVIDVGDGVVELINPEIVEQSGEQEDIEGCLSCPGITVPVSRKPWARVRYYDLDGEMWEIEGDGLLGRCLQHEIDHLNGRTLFESCDPLTRIRALEAYDEARKKGAKPGDTSIEVD